MNEHPNLSDPHLGFEAWLHAYRSICEGYSVGGNEPDTFAGLARPLSMHGLSALEVACNDCRIDRSPRDTRAHALDLYGVVLQMSGCSDVIHNGKIAHVAQGDIVLVDKSRPVSYLADGTGAHWLCLQLPRRDLISHLGFEPTGGSHVRAGMAAGRLLFELALSGRASEGTPLCPADSFLQLTAYDLIGALFVPELRRRTYTTDKLFDRLYGIVMERFTDPDFGPGQLAAESGISLRYVHKLFTERDLTCREFIYALRLEHSAQLIKRSRGRPLSEIAFASGFRDYAHFARRFRSRYGRSPGANSRFDRISLRDGH